MARFVNHIIILALLLIVFNMGGLLSGDNQPTLLKAALDPSDLFTDLTSLNFKDIFVLLTSGVGIAGGIYLAYYFKDMSLIAMSIALPLAIQWAVSVYAIYQQFGALPTTLSALLIFPFIISLFMSIIDWWRSPIA